jgi:T-complex protein 1 subunit gamma
MANYGPILVMNQNSQRQTGREAQMGNILAAKTVADIVRTTLGPRSMLKMLLDPMGGIVLTNDGNAILREVDVSHPAAKSMIELSRAQDEEVGDGTTSVIILAGEILTLSASLIERAIHPTVIVRGFYRALEEALAIAKRVATEVDPNNDVVVRELIAATVGTKISSRYGELMVNMAIQAVRTVFTEENGKVDIDLKRYAKVEKVPGGDLTDCRVIDGLMLNKDIVHSKMRRRIENPRILLLDCALEYKKSESQMNFEITEEGDWNKLLKQEEEYIKNLCANIVAVRPDVVFTEKGLSDLAQHYFVKAGISAIRRIRKTDANRIARATGATIVSRTEEICEADIGTGAGLFEVRKVGDEYFTYIEQCKQPKACTIVLRGASKDVLMEMERNLMVSLQKEEQD